MLVKQGSKFFILNKNFEKKKIIMGEIAKRKKSVTTCPGLPYSVMRQ